MLILGRYNLQLLIRYMLAGFKRRFPKTYQFLEKARCYIIRFLDLMSGLC